MQNVYLDCHKDNKVHHVYFVALHILLRDITDLPPTLEK